MVLFNYSTRELTAKVVYYGPGLCGKTTNLQFIYDSLPDSVKKGKMLSLATKTDRTLFFDFLPIDLGMIRGMKTRVQLYTVPGQVFYNSTRKLVLKGADGVVFVADSQTKMLEASIESYKNLEDNLREMGIRIDEVPLVMQFNKRDLPSVCSVEEMNTQINRHNAPFYESVAMTGIGVEDTLKAITKLVLNNLASKYKVEGAPAGAQAAAAPAARSRVVSAAKPAAKAVSSPEDFALDALDVEETQAAAPARAQPVQRRAPIATRAQEGAMSDERDVIDLGEDLLEELEEEPAQAAARPGGARPVISRPAAPPLRAVRAQASAVSEDPVDLDDPIDLEEPWEPPAAPPTRPGGAPAQIGSLTPGQDRTIDLPVELKIEGRAVRINVRITVRLAN